MPARPRHPLLRDLAALAVLAAVVAGGVAWWRAAAAARLWQPVTLEAEGVRFRIPPGWTVTPLGYADPDFAAGRPGRGIVVTARSFAIPPEMRRAAAGRGLERAALDAWAEGQRAGAPRGQRLVAETSLRIDGERGILQVFEDRRDALPVSAVAAAAHGGRLYSFHAQAGPAVEAATVARTLRRILRTVRWLPRAPAAHGAL